MGFILLATLEDMGRAFRVETLAMRLPHLAMGLMAAATGTVFLQLQPLRVVAPVFHRSIVTLPAIAALQSDDLPNVPSSSRHVLIQYCFNLILW